MTAGKDPNRWDLGPVDYQVLSDGYLYVPFSSAPLAGGIFLPASTNTFEQYLKVPIGLLSGAGKHGNKMLAAKIFGNSMTGKDIFNGDVVIYRYSEFSYVEAGRIAVVERLGDEEGTGAWTLKLLVVHPSSHRRDDAEVEMASRDLTVILRPFNRNLKAWALDPNGDYRIRGYFETVIHAQDVELVDSDFVGNLAGSSESQA